MCDIDSFAPLSSLLQGMKYRQTTENTHRSVLLFSQEYIPLRRAQPSASHTVRCPTYIARGIKQ